MERFFGNRPITLYASGTAALAQAVARCAARSDSSRPQAIIPAYGCPDLVAACVHAGVYPRMVDVSTSFWSYDMGALREAISPDTVGIVAVNLLGLGDGARDVHSLCTANGIPLIQDSAQHLPREPQEWPGDYVVLSFGRGKPLNLLRGGALVSTPGDTTPCPPSTVVSARTRLLNSRAAAIGFNILSRPGIYGIVSALPGSGVGDVSYTPLRDASALPDREWRRVGTAFHIYRQEPSYRRELWATELREWRTWGIMPLESPGVGPSSEPLRLAVLAPTAASCERLTARLARIGAGASRFYATDLPAISGVPENIRCQGPFPNAQLLAAKLFTLPTHQLVTPRDVRRVHDEVLAWHREEHPSDRIRPIE